MEYTTLGKTGLKISKVCLGCMGLGNPKTGQHTWTQDEEHSLEIIKEALALGINFFDTAAVYQQGSSEQYLGKALKAYSSRDKVVIATKFIPRSKADIQNHVSVHDHIMSMLDNSLKRLDVDYVDLYIYHMWDYASDLKEILKTLHKAVSAGKIKALGISNCFAYQLARANLIAYYEVLTPFSSIQGHLNLIFREEEREMVPCAQEFGMTISPYSPLAGGKLCRLQGTSKRFEEDSYLHFKYDKSASVDEEIIERVYELSQKYQVSMTAIALNALILQGYVPVTGVTSKAQLADLNLSVSLNLSAEDLAYLKEPYVPHALVGVMAQNTKENALKDQVWQQNKR